ncbi:unnamed protein product [Anisakis simplex]|uniref:RRM domain-containing protein n=1 Tax=Anisakis simplex TaxID=6269 RepID=A0A3P6PG14_ANISI|nr:unnamed protein product [Anisakis simplex]
MAFVIDIMEDVCDNAKSANPDDVLIKENEKPSDAEDSGNHDIGSADVSTLNEPEANGADQTVRKGCRVQLQNLPRFMGFKQFKTFLAKNVGKESVRKIRVTSDTAYFSMATPEEALEAVRILNDCTIKKSKISAKIVNDEPPKGRDIQRSNADECASAVQKTAREIVTPFADVEYSEQLQYKMANASRLTKSLINMMKFANIKAAYSMNPSHLIKPIRRSPQIEGYRNKCEFTIGHDLDEAVCVGFVGGRFSASKHYVVPIDTCTNISERMKNIVSEFQQFVAKSGEEVTGFHCVAPIHR